MPSQPGDPPTSDPPREAPPRFIVDVNAGKLAKWLRILGFDALFINPIEDNTLVEIALHEGRVLLTRDTHIAERRVATTGQVKVVVVQGDRVSDQLRFVASALGLRGPFEMFSRCLQCDVPLENLDRSVALYRVPPHVYLTQERFMACPRCGKIYWPGTHWQRMTRMATSMMEGGEETLDEGTGSSNTGKPV